MSDRPGWDEYFLRIAFEVATRSTCLRRQVGCVLVRGRRILATGYNGVPRGLPHCDEVGCIREREGVPSGQRHELCRGLHAEMNAFLQAAIHGVSVDGSELYSSTHPCVLCTKMLIQAGVKRVIAAEGYPDELSAEMLKEARVKVERIDMERRGR